MVWLYIRSYVRLLELGLDFHWTAGEAFKTPIARVSNWTQIEYSVSDFFIVNL